jgi:hypothetical protein
MSIGLGVAGLAALDRVSRYADELRAAAFEALDEEAVLIVVFSVFHAM